MRKLGAPMTLRPATRHLLLSVCVALASALVVSGCSSILATETVSGSDVSSAQKSVATSIVTEKVCVDATASSAANFASGAIAAVAAAVAGWVPKFVSGKPTTEVKSVPGLDLFLRQVTTSSYATDQPSLEIQIPPVPTLPAPPDIGDPNFATDELNWNTTETLWVKRLSNSRAAEVSALVSIDGYELDQSPSNMSAISGCMAALTEQGVQNDTTRMILASDLMENEPPVSANYGGAAILVDESCPAYADASCGLLAYSWAARFKGQGAGRVSFVRADSAVQPIQQWMKGARP